MITAVRVICFTILLSALPALKAGFVMDDLPQHTVELKPDQLPPLMHEMGNSITGQIGETHAKDYYVSAMSGRMIIRARNYNLLEHWLKQLVL